MRFGPSDRWYEPPEPREPCCSRAEDEDDHDVQACLDEQAEAAAELKYEALREREREPSDDEIYNGNDILDAPGMVV